MAKVVIFSGAGISAESGIKTFRDTGGLWENNRIEDVCTRGCLEKNRTATLKFYNQRRIELKDKSPNDAHIKIAELKKKYAQDIAVITQNVDDLFERAGCQDLIHLHGFIREIRCMRRSCNYVAKAAIFHYIEMFYNSKRRHSYLDYLSPNEFKIRYYLELKNLEVLSNN